MAVVRSKPMSAINSNLVTGGPTYYGSMESKDALRFDYPKLKQKVTAFGPIHADHARMFYLSKVKQPESRRVLIPAYGPNYGRTYETILKEAKISPRPNEKQTSRQKTIRGFGEKLLREKVTVRTSVKSIDFQSKEMGMDLSDAPLFQILCEISKIKK